MARKSLTGKQGQAGFTLMELLMVLFIIGLLAALAWPGIQGAVKRAEEAALRENLNVMRRSIDAFYSDRSHYPETLDILVQDQYLRFIPHDPVTEVGSDWQVVQDDKNDGIIDVHSRSNKIGSDGKPYREW